MWTKAWESTCEEAELKWNYVPLLAENPNIYFSFSFSDTEESVAILN